MSMLMEFPAFFEDLTLKAKLSWLYHSVYGRLPIVRTGASARILNLVKDMEIQKHGRINDALVEKLVFNLATDCVQVYPETTKMIGRWGNMGVGYYLLCSPVCFFMPYLLFFQDSPVRSPWIDPVRDIMESALGETFRQEAGQLYGIDR